jgi:hypothetical protein
MFLKVMVDFNRKRFVCHFPLASLFGLAAFFMPGLKESRRQY